MAIVTVEGTKNLIKLAIGMFGIAPGQSYLKLMKEAMEAGNTLLQLATTLSATDKFQATYPNGMGPDDFIEVFSAKFLAPLGMASAQYQWLRTWAENSYQGGKTPAHIIVEALQALDATTHAGFAPAKAVLNNQAEVAYYHAELLASTETDFTKLAQVLVGVTADPASVDAAKTALNPPPPPAPEPPAPPPPPPPPPPPAATLTAGADTFNLTAADELIDAPVATLGSPDSIDGAGGNDKLTATLASASIAPTITNVETIALTVNSSSQLDASNVTGVTKYTLTGAGNFTFSAGNIAGGVEIDASALTGNLTIAGSVLGAVTIKGGSGNDTLKGSNAADTLVGGGGDDTIQLGAVSFLPSGTGADTITTGTGNDVVRFVASVAAGTGAATNYTAFAHITDFALASDQLAFSANDTSFTHSVANGLAKGAAAQALDPGDAMVVQTVAKDTSATAATDVSFIKLTTAVAFTTDVKGTFAAALGTAVIDTLAANGNYLVSAYDTTNSRMVLAVVNVGSNTGGDTNLASSDFTNAGISVVGVFTMSATDYANFGAGQLAAAF